MTEKLQRLQGESGYNHLKRIVNGKLVDKNIDTEFEDLSEIIFGDGNCFNSSEVRKRMYGIKHVIKVIEQDIVDGFADNDLLKEYETKKIELNKARIRLSDQRNDLNKYIRESARWESVLESVEKSASIVAQNKPFLKVDPIYKHTNKKAVLCLSDWHYSLTCENFLNEYNIDVFKERINKLVKKTIENCLFQEVETLNVVLLGDLVSGNIHTLTRIQNQTDIISQVQEVSEFVSEMLYEFSKYFNVEVYNVNDNHSRITPDKKENLPTETFCRIIEWYLKARLHDNENINFNDNKYGLEIATFDVYNTKFAATHGNLDKMGSVVQDLTLMTKQFYDVVLTAHLHHSSSDETHSTDIISNPSLCGVDTYSLSLRRTSKPAQNLLIVNQEGIECIYKINL